MKYLEFKKKSKRIIRSYKILCYTNAILYY